MMQFTPTRPLVLALASAALLLGGCADMSARQKGTATGAAAGAAVGAVLSKVTGGKAGSGAVIGGAVGAVAARSDPRCASWRGRIPGARHGAVGSPVRVTAHAGEFGAGCRLVRPYLSGFGASVAAGRDLAVGSAATW